MAAALDRAAFFEAVRAKPFGGSLSKTQVSGMEAILDACPPDLGLDAFAYCFATAFHETARTMLPIKEYGGTAYYTRMYDILGERPDVAKTLGNTKAGDGALFAGRGYVQLTGRANYRRATAELQNRGYLIAAQDLVITPDLALVPDIAAAIMFCGMEAGWFTGKKLTDYFGPGKLADPANARRIINGLDKAQTIAGYFSDFQKALKAAGYKPGGIAVSIPTPPVEITPVAPPPAITPPTQPVPKPSWGAWLVGKLSLPWS